MIEFNATLTVDALTERHWIEPTVRPFEPAFNTYIAEREKSRHLDFKQVEIPLTRDEALAGPLRDEFFEVADPDQLHAVLHAAQDAAEVDHFGLHGLRPLYCSLLVNSGAPVKDDAQERLGHASATTIDIYAHAISQDGRKFSAAVEAAFSSVSYLLAENNPGQGTQEVLN